MEDKKFDVLISPTDVLEEELREVLGGGADCLIQCSGLCVKKCDSKCQSQGSSGEPPKDCPPGYILVNGDCVEPD